MSRSGSVQGAAIQHYSLNFHEHDDGVCRYEDQVYFDTYLEACDAQSRSWFACHAARIRDLSVAANNDCALRVLLYSILTHLD